MPTDREVKGHVTLELATLALEVVRLAMLAVVLVVISQLI